MSPDKVSMNCVDDFVSGYASAGLWWEALDRPILRACKEYPTHSDAREVFGKVALVNRAYRANLQMGVKDAEWKLAELLVNDNADKVISPLSCVSAFSRDTLETILAVHDDLVRLTYRVTNRVENSFCAKYLSFHFPEVVPLFDGYAYACSWRLMKERLPRGLYRDRWNVDYGYHCEAVLALVEVLHERGIRKPVLKLVDSVLYGAR